MKRCGGRVSRGKTDRPDGLANEWMTTCMGRDLSTSTGALDHETEIDIKSINNCRRFMGHGISRLLRFFINTSETSLLDPQYFL